MRAPIMARRYIRASRLQRLLERDAAAHRATWHLQCAHSRALVAQASVPDDGQELDAPCDAAHREPTPTPATWHEGGGLRGKLARHMPMRAPVPPVSAARRRSESQLSTMLFTGRAPCDTARVHRSAVV